MTSTSVRLLRVEEIADALGVKASWVYGKVACHEMPCVRVGRYLRFRLEEVMAWLESRDAA